MYHLKLNLPNMAKGAEVEIDGLGVFRNGHEYEIEPHMAESFRNSHARSVPTFGDDGSFTQERVLGPTLLQTFKDNPSITVTTVEEKKGDEDK
jgi:hypothetical protein